MFAAYDFERLARYTRTRILFLYNEAQRQRTANALLLSETINKIHNSKKDQITLANAWDTFMHPYKQEADKHEIYSGWNELRGRNRR